MSFSAFIFPFFFSGFIYLILTAQVHSGFPPFYRRANWDLLSPETEREIKMVLPFVFGLMVTMVLFALTEFPGFMLAAGLIAIWGRLRLRQDLSRTTDGPLHWVTNPWPSHPFYTLTWTVRWPMLVFDIWTVGMSVGFGMLILLPGPS